MKYPAGLTGDLSEYLNLYAKAWGTNEKLLAAILDQAKATQTYWLGLCRCINDFMAPSLTALNSLAALERDKREECLPSQDRLADYLGLWQYNLQMVEKALLSGLKTMNDYHMRHMHETFKAWLNTALGLEGEDIAAFMAGQAKIMDLLVHEYPKAIRAIASEYGLHFDDGGYVRVAETERFDLYQVLPRHKGIKVRKNGKPIIIIPPFVLGANIMAFLPGEDKSFVHCFANQGIPTYIRITKDIHTTEAVQIMTGEDDCRDTRLFCEQLQARHGKPVTLCGYCQGGFTAVVNLLTGQLDGLVDALITCVSPMDGTRSKGLKGFLDRLPGSYMDAGVSIKTLANGNQVVDGRLLSWVFKLKNIDSENPITTFYRDLKLLEKGKEISKTAAAINYWMLYDVTDLPVAITKMSFDSYTIPVAEDGTLPVKLFGRSLNFKRIKEKGIHWLICAAEKDDLVEKEASLTPLKWVDAEVTIFPKGHVAIATSWTLPTSECSLDKCFLDYRGPVRYQLDLEAALVAPVSRKPKTKPASAPKPPAGRS
jgi:poly(3-hydroxyalkanoate) synthetase